LAPPARSAPAKLIWQFSGAWNLNASLERLLRLAYHGRSAGRRTLDITISWRFVNPVMKTQYGIDSMLETARTMAIGPVPAMNKLIERLGFKIDDFDWIELNEAFAS
jgi:hypothetical protein